MLAVAEVVDGVWIPHVRSSRVGGVGGAIGGTEVHVGHGNLVDVVCWVLGCDESACWCYFAEDDVCDGLTTGLSWISSPDKRTNVFLLLDESGVESTT